MQLTVAAALLATVASFASAQSVPGNTPNCVKYCLRIAREQDQSGSCTWAGWCSASGFQGAVENCLNNTCGRTNQQIGRDIYQQICSSAGSNTVCPTSGTPSATSAVASVSSVVASVTSSVASVSQTSTSPFDASTSSVAASTSSVVASVTSSVSSVSTSIAGAASTATAPVNSAITSLLSSASSVAASASSVAANPTNSPNAGVAVGVPTHGQIATIGALFLGAAAGAFML